MNKDLTSNKILNKTYENTIDGELIDMNSRRSMRSVLSSISSYPWWIVLYFTISTRNSYIISNNIIFISAYETAAGSCNSSYAPVDEYHIEATTVASKSLATDYPDITVTFNDRIIKFNDTRPIHYVFATNQIYEWKIKMTTWNMRGILMRVQAPIGTTTNVTDGMLVSNKNT